MPKLLSELAFGAFLAYSPNGPRHVEPHHSSQVLRAAVKGDGIYRGELAIDLAIRRLAELRPEALQPLFDPEVVLVPAPRSSPFPEGLSIPLRGRERDFLWVPRRICEALVAAGLASTWRPLLRRVRKVPRSSAVEPKDRPTPQAHLDSMECSPQSSTGQRYLVVDDVVTRGATLLACASLVVNVHPAAEVRGLALLRAVSNPDDFQSILDPVAGTVRLRPQGDTLRRP